MRRWRLVVCALSCAFLTGTVVSLAANPPEKSAAKKAEAEKRPAKATAPPIVRGIGVEVIEAALAKPMQCEFVETPLKDVVEYLQDVAHVQMYLDSAALKEAGIDDSAPITCNLRGLQFEKVLNLVLDSQKLKWTIHHDVLYITSSTKFECEELFETRALDVADLVVYQDETGKKFEDYSPLVDMITAAIDPKSWLDNGGAGTIQGQSLGTAKVLVVTHRYDVQKKVSALVAEIRAIAAKKSGDDLPYRERPKAGQPATTGCFHCPGMIPDRSSVKDAAPQSKPAEAPAQK